ncbi:MAG: LysM peptidoglycan-binding domain-containing protein [Eubacterium sp.]|nr:LysM peptidoglycan-binding domain-containing protein [Eubacterium sp.]
MSRARRAEIDVDYEHVNITASIEGNLKSFSYTDVASGETDSISLVLQDREHQWMGSWAPQKGDHISASAVFRDWEGEGDNWEIYCGSFEVDDIQMSGPPAACTIGAVSIPRSEAFNEEERTKNWVEVTVKEIAAEIAARAGIELYYEADEIMVDAVEQDRQTDCKFLYSICEKYGLAMKVFAEKIVLFDEAVYESAAPAVELGYSDLVRYTYESKLEGTYTGAKIAYSDPGTGENHIVTVGGGSRIKEINEEADNAADAQRKAVAALNNANKEDTRLSATVKAKKELIASRCIRISGCGTMDGIYYLDKVTTKVGGNGVSQQSFEAHRVGYRMDNAKVLIDEEPETLENTEGGDYTVVKGDTLWKIAEVMLGAPMRYAEIYELNKEVIESRARERGKKDSANGHWIFSGTVLQMPGLSGGEESGGQ